MPRQQHQEQGDGQADTPGQRFYRALALAAVADQIDQAAEQAQQDQDEKESNEDAHGW